MYSTASTTRCPDSLRLVDALDHAETGHRLAGHRIGHSPRDHQPRVERHDVLLIRGGQGYGFLAQIPIFEDMDEHGVARGTCPRVKRPASSV